MDARDKMMEKRLRWFGHVMRQREEDLVRAILRRAGGEEVDPK